MGSHKLFYLLFSLCHWLKNFFTYYFSGPVKIELIAKINDDKDLQPQVKHELIESIIQNQPQQLLEQLQPCSNKPQK